MSVKVTFIDPAEGETHTEIMDFKKYQKMYESSDCRIIAVEELEPSYPVAPERCKYSGETDCNDCSEPRPCGADADVDETEPIPESGSSLVSDRVANRLFEIKTELIKMYDDEGLYLSTESCNAISEVVTALYKAESMLKNTRSRRRY